jgi:hypothetical protein
LEELLRRGVEVFIGFGITERGPDDRKARQGDQTLGWLQRKAEQYRNLHVVRLGDTHAKVLLMDNRFVVVGSFNWMSFGGFDRNENGVRVVREELSTVVTVPAMIEQMFQRFRSRFDRYIGGVQPKPTPDASSLGKLAFPEAKPVPGPTPAKGPKPAQPAPVVAPMALTPRMIATHLGKKPFVVIATAMEKSQFATMETVLSDENIRAIYSEFKAALPSPSELAILRGNTGKQ